MPTDREMAKALKQRSAMKRQKDEVRAAAVARAVGNVLDGSCESCEDAARGQGVNAEAVRAAVRAERERRRAVGQ